MLRLHRPEAKNPLVVTSLASGGFEPVPYGLIRAPNSRASFLFFFPAPLSETILFLFSLRHDCSDLFEGALVAQIRCCSDLFEGGGGVA